MSLTAEARYQKKWKYDRAHGLTRLADATKARQHIEHLSMMGASYRGIADAAGLSVQAICGIRDGQPTAKHATLATILKVKLEDTFARSGGEDFVLNIGAKRRIRALMRIGHAATTIGAVIGKSDRWIYNALHQQGRWVSRDKHDLIATAYDALSMTPGASGKTITLATKAGYLPPLAWDDDIDDPNAESDTGEVPVTMGPAAQTHLEDIEDCIDWGLDRRQAARRLGIDVSAIEHRCERTDRRDLLLRLDRNKDKNDLRLTVAS